MFCGIYSFFSRSSTFQDRTGQDTGRVEWRFRRTTSCGAMQKTDKLRMSSRRAGGIDDNHTFEGSQRVGLEDAGTLSFRPVYVMLLLLVKHTIIWSGNHSHKCLVSQRHTCPRAEAFLSLSLQDWCERLVFDAEQRIQSGKDPYASE